MANLSVAFKPVKADRKAVAIRALRGIPIEVPKNLDAWLWLASLLISGASEEKALEFQQATAVTCREAHVDHILLTSSRLFRQQSIADSTPRLIIPEQIGRLEEIGTELRVIPEKECAAEVNPYLMDNMDDSIAMFISFSADESDQTVAKGYPESLPSLVALDDQMASSGYSGGLVRAFRERGYFHTGSAREGDQREGTVRSSMNASTSSRVHQGMSPR